MIDLSSLSSSDGFVIQGVNQGTPAGHRLGESTSTAGDFNNDGIADFIVGTQLGNTAYLIFGKSGPTRDNIDTAALAAGDGFALSIVANNGAGRSVSLAGDINNDGYSDVIIGEPFNDDLTNNAGGAYVVFGGAGSTHADVDLANLGGSGLFRSPGEEGAQFGRSVSNVGDFDGDGMDDYVVGAPYASVIVGDVDGPFTDPADRDDLTEAGKIYVFSGSALLVTIIGTAPRVDVNSAPAGDNAGWSVAAAGDLNGDGMGDIIIGARKFDGNGPDSGAAFVVYGTANGGEIDLGNLGAGGFKLQGKATLDFAGYSVSGAGDVNGDGFADIIVGAPFNDDGGNVAGKAYVIYGTGSQQSDIDLGNVTGTVGFTIEGNPVTTLGANVSGAGDFNNDGIDDVIVGAAGESGGGAAYIIFGKAATQRDNILVSSLSADDGLAIFGAASNDGAGRDVGGAGDVNGDGFDDVIVGANGNDAGGNLAGAAYVIFGRSGNNPPVAADDSIVARSAEITGISGAALLSNDSDVDGDTLTITMVGIPAHGTANLVGDQIICTSDAGYIGPDSFIYTVSDGNGGTDTGSVNITVIEANQPPVADASKTVTTLTDTAIVIDVMASDPDGDTLSYIVTGAANGTVSVDDGGFVTYTPVAGFMGSDSVTVDVRDGKGGRILQELTVTVKGLPLSDQFVMFAATGFAGGAGGSGAINGNDGFQQISVIDVPGAIALDPSFNRGGDLVQLAGDASAWNVTRIGSSALFSDGDTFVTVPIGTAGLAMQFDDGLRTLIFDGSNFTIGGQAFASGTLSPITAAPDGTTLPSGADPVAKAVLFIAADAGIAASGVVDIFGAAGDELASLISGNLTLDASFNNGGDTIAFDEAASDYFASQSGSSVRLTGSDTTALIPVGTSGAALAFGDGSDTRTMLIDTGIPGITIGGQLIGADPVQLLAA